MSELLLEDEWGTPGEREGKDPQVGSASRRRDGWEVPGKSGEPRHGESGSQEQPCSVWNDALLDNEPPALAGSPRTSVPASSHGTPWFPATNFLTGLSARAISWFSTQVEIFG